MHWFHLVFVAILTGHAIGNDCETGAINAVNEWNENFTAIDNILTEKVIIWLSNYTDPNEDIVDVYWDGRDEMIKNGYENIRPFLSCQLSEKVHRHLLNIEKLSIYRNRDLMRTRDKFIKQQASLIGNTTVCNVNGESCMISNLDVNSSNVETRKEIWVKSREITGKTLKAPFIKYVQDNRKGFSKFGRKKEFMTMYSNMDGISRSKIKEAIEELMPLYRQLNSYRRTRMRDVYTDVKFPQTGHIPAHILEDLVEGNIIFDNIRPFNSSISRTFRDALRNQNYTQKMIYKIVDDFYKSLRMPGLSDNFEANSIFTTPEDGRPTRNYQYHFRNQSGVIHKGNPSFSYLLGALNRGGLIQTKISGSIDPPLTTNYLTTILMETIGLSMQQLAYSPKFLNRLGLLPNPYYNNETEINVLMSIAVEDAANVFNYILVEWMASAETREILPERYNEKWWELRCKYQGVSPPIERKSYDFDPGRHNLDGTWKREQNIVQTLWKYQILEAACKESGHTGPLYLCDIHGSEAAGRLLWNLLTRDLSKSVFEVLKEFPGVETLSSKPLMNYMEPLLEFLTKENKKNNETVGWSNECPCFD